MRLINADTLIEILKRNKQFFIDAWGGSFHAMSEKDKARYDEIDNCIAEILTAPTIGPKTGMWTHSHIGTIAEGFYCSRCGKLGYKTDFCPNCGADMRKGGDINVDE